MTRLHLCLCLVALAAAVCLLPACDSGPKPPEERTIRGEPVVEKGDDGTVSSIRIEAEKRDRVYHIVLDEKGKQLADMAGKSLVVTGMYQRKGDERWMTVKEARETTPEDDKRPAKDRNAPADKKATEDTKLPEQKAPEAKKAPEEAKAPEAEKAPEPKAAEEK